MRLAITGLGAVGPFGVGAEELERAWRGADPAPVEVDRAAGHHRALGARTALLAGDLDLSAWLTPAQARRMSPPVRQAVAAARGALADAAIDSLEGGDRDATAVVSGTAFGPAWVTEQLLLQILGQGPAAASPALFTESVASAAAGQTAIALGARGPNVALTQREASDLAALAEAARLLRTGAARCAIVVVVDEMTPLLHAVLDRLRALARPDAGGVETARPLDRRRCGALASEGAVALVVEPAEVALGRGVAPRAELLAVAGGFDRTAPPWGWGRGAAALGARLARGLERAGVAPEDLAGVVSGAAGSPAGDRLEAATLRTALGDRVPPVGAPKGALGAWGGGLLGAAVVAAGSRDWPATAGFGEADDGCAIAPLAAPATVGDGPVLVSSLASGGAAWWALLDRFREAAP